MDQNNERIAIIGGGISGLTAALRIAELEPRREVHLFESSERLGGVLQTEYVDDFCLEIGPDSMLSRLPWGIDLCRRIGFESELVGTNESGRGVHVVCRGRLCRIPDGLAIMAPQRIWPMVTTPTLSLRGKLRLAAEWFVPRRQTDEDESLAAFSRRRLGRETFERLIQPLAGGIYMGDPERLSMQATFPQFVDMERRHGSLIRANRKDRAGSRNQPAATGPQYSLFVAPRRGMGQLVDALAARLADCRIHRHHCVERLRPNADGWQLGVEDSSSGSHREESFAGVVMALPACHAAPLVAPIHDELAQRLGEIPYAACVVVNLAYDQSALTRPLESFGFVVPHIEERPVLACTVSSLKYPRRAPEGKVLLRAFLGGDCFPEVPDWSDERILDAVQGQLGELLGIAGQPLFTRIKRWRRSMAQYHVGHLARVEQIEGLSSKFPTLQLAGNSYRGVGIPHCIRSGEEAGGQLLERLQQAVQVQH